MKKLHIGSVLLAALLLTGCGGGVTQRNDYSLNLNQNSSSQADGETKEIPEGAITDDSGEFVFTGNTVQGGDDENGYIQVPATFVPFQEEDVEGLTQYSDTSGSDIITLDFYEGISYQMAAENMRYYLSQEETLEDLQGATVTVGGYNALQLYGHYTDGFFIVVWLIEDPSNTENCYYLAMEFTADYSDIMALSSTFETVHDHNEKT